MLKDVLGKNAPDSVEDMQCLEIRICSKSAQIEFVCMFSLRVKNSER